MIRRHIVAGAMGQSVPATCQRLVAQAAEWTEPKAEFPSFGNLDAEIPES